MRSGMPSALSMSLALAAVAACSMQAQAQNSNPLQIRRLGFGNVEGMKKNIFSSVAGCRLVRKLPADAPVPMPPDEYLAKLPVIEIEELFNGKQWAEYGTERYILADPANCEPKLFVSRGVTTETVCASRLQASQPRAQEMASIESPKPPTVTFKDGTPRTKGCGKPAKPTDLAGVPVQDAGKGVKCVWQSDIVGAAMKAAGMAGGGHDGKSDDFCLYARLPYYTWNGYRRDVVVKTFSTNKSLAGGDISEHFGEVKAAGNLQLESLNDGSGISPDRFTRAGIEAFMNQPSKLPLKEKP